MIPRRLFVPLKNIANILLFCFALSFVQKTSFGLLTYSKYGKELKQNINDAPCEEESDEVEDNISEEDNKFDAPAQYFKLFSNFQYSCQLDLIVNNNVLYFLAQLHFFKSPALSIFAPPPNK